MTESKAYGGTYTYEGHDVHFRIQENGITMEILESKDGNVVKEVVMNIADAVDYQDKLIEWGYTSY